MIQGDTQSLRVGGVTFGSVDEECGENKGNKVRRLFRKPGENSYRPVQRQNEWKSDGQNVGVKDEGK